MNSHKSDSTRSSFILFFPLFFLVLVLEIIHLPSEIMRYRPDFMVILLLFFAIRDPQRISIGTAWMAGLVLDLLTGAPFGVNALVMASQVFFVMSQFRHFGQFTAVQQAVIIGILNFIALALVYWIEHILGAAGSVYSHTYQTLTTMVFWPLARGILSYLWEAFNIGRAGEDKDKEL